MGEGTRGGLPRVTSISTGSKGTDPEMVLQLLSTRRVPELPEQRSKVVYERKVTSSPVQDY